jgi:PIF1-like helicase
MSQPSQLKMYLGGMGGTRKSQVIKALISFFERHNESHRIMILAPTGSAAALLNGSTYHSVLGINSTKDGDTVRNEHIAIAQVKVQLDSVDYIFWMKYQW